MNVLNHKKNITSKGLLLGISFVWSIASITAASTGTVALFSLFISTDLDPSIILILNDGSMVWSYLPNSVSCYGGSILQFIKRGKSAAVNTVYYNSMIIHTPPINQDRVSLNDASSRLSGKMAISMTLQPPICLPLSIPIPLATIRMIRRCIISNFIQRKTVGQRRDTQMTKIVI